METEIDQNRNTAALETKPPPIHLGQGFMKYDTFFLHIIGDEGIEMLIFSFKPPQFLIQAAKDALDDVATNQYSHTRGRLRLRQALSDAYSPYFGRKLDPETVSFRNLPN